MKDNEEERKVREADATVKPLASPSRKDDENKEKGKECETKENELQGNHLKLFKYYALKLRIFILKNLALT